MMQHNEAHTTEHHHPAMKTYYLVFAALIVLLLLSVGVAEVDLGRWNFAAAVGIATVKAIMILLIFMHVRYSPRLIWLFSVAGFFWLAILFSLTFSDYATR